LLLCTLICAASIEWGGEPLPQKLIAPALIVGLAAPMALRALHPLAVSRDFGSWLASHMPEGVVQVLASVATSAVGLAFGALLGYLVSLAKRPDSSARVDRHSAMLLAGLIGLMLGWQAVAIVAAAAIAYLLIAILGRPFPRFRAIPWSAGLTIIVALFMMNGRAVVELLGRLGTDASLLMPIAAVGVTLLCAVATRTMTSRR